MSDRERELALVRRILDGSTEAWHSFLDTYAGLIHAVIRKHVFGDEDEVRSVFVSVLTTLHQRALSTYEGRASLATWLAIVTRGQAIEHLRQKLGRRRLPRSISRLGPLEQRTFALRHVEGWTLEAILDQVRIEGIETDREGVLAALRTVEEGLDPGLRLRLAYNLEAARQGGTSGRLLELADRLRFDVEAITDDPLGDDAKEAARLADQVRGLLTRLSDEEREVLRLRFEEERTAAEIAATLGLGDSRRVYTIAERALRRLRRWLDLDAGGHS